MPALLLLPLLFLTGLMAGLVDSIAGGGGLITIPVLLGVGMPPQIALGTNKLQASFGSGSAMLTFIRSGTVQLNDCRIGVAYTAIGAALAPLPCRSSIPASCAKSSPGCWLPLCSTPC